METRETVSAVYYLDQCSSTCVSELVSACCSELQRMFGDQVVAYKHLCICSKQHPAKRVEVQASEYAQICASIGHCDCSAWHVHLEAGFQKRAQSDTVQWSLHALMNTWGCASAPVHMIVCNVDLASVSRIVKAEGLRGLLDLFCTWAANSDHVISGLIDVSHNNDTKAGMYYVIEPSLASTTWERKRAASEWRAHTSSEVAQLCRGVYWGTYLRDDLLQRLSQTVLEEVLDQSAGLAPLEEAPRIVRMRCGTAVLLSHSPESMLSAYQEDDNARAELRMATLLSIELRRRRVML